MAGHPWTREEALVAFNVYCRLPFGKLDGRNPEIQRIAASLGRTPSSLAMKCCNFASLDPTQRERGISGLQKVAQIDREIWTEFEANAEKFSFESEIAFAKLNGATMNEVEQEPQLENGTQTLSRPVLRWEEVSGMDREAIARVRINQRFFRTIILASYDSSCAVCALPIPSLLVASHIVPWSVDHSLRMNPRNGLCLCSMHDRAFDTGVMLIDKTYTVRIVSLEASWRNSPPVAQFLIAYDGQRIRSPNRWHPDAFFLDRRIQIETKLRGATE